MTDVNAESSTAPETNDVTTDSSPDVSLNETTDNVNDLSDLPDELFDNSPKEPIEAVDTSKEDTENSNKSVEAKEQDSPSKEEEPKPGSKEYNFRQLREQRAKAEKENQALQEELLKYKKAMEFVLKKQQTDVQKLNDLRGELSPEQKELESLRLDRESHNFQQKLQEEVQKLRFEFEQKARAEQEYRILEEQKHQYLNEIDSVLAKHPALDKKQFALAVKEDMDNGGDGDFSRVAQELDTRMYQAYESKFLEVNKSKLNAPKVISTQGSIRPAYAESDEDTLKWLDATLGDDWDKME